MTCYRFNDNYVSMKASDIRAELVRRNITVTSIAKKTGVSTPAVSQVIYSVRGTHRIRQAIAEAIGRPVSEVFPENNQEAA